MYPEVAAAKSLMVNLNVECCCGYPRKEEEEEQDPEIDLYPLISVEIELDRCCCGYLRKPGKGYQRYPIAAEIPSSC